MTGIWALVAQLLTQFFSWFAKDQAKKEQIEKDVKRELEQYERETGTSADVREAAKKTKERLLEKLRSKQK